jgi:putative ABC transport system permease protein
MITLLSTWTFGLALGFVALGVFVSYRLFSFPDITTDGSFTLGAVVATVLLVAGVDPLLATLGGMAAGAVAGSCTGMLHALLGIEPLLSGILLTTALASINLVVLGRTPSDSFTRWLLGSTSEAVLGQAASSVLIVPVEKKA